MSIQELNNGIISEASSISTAAVPIKQKKGFFKLFGKTFTIFAWLFTAVVLLNLEPATKTIDTLSSLDSFLRYIRGEDTEFEKGIDDKYVKLKESFSTIKTSSFKSLMFVKTKLQTPIDLVQGGFDAVANFLESIGEQVQTYVPSDERTTLKNES